MKEAILRFVSKRRKLFLVVTVTALVVGTVGFLVFSLLINTGAQDQLKAAISVRRLDPAPAAAYSVTSEDIMQYPLIEKVLNAYDDPDCCPEATRVDGNLTFRVSEAEGLEVSSYLLEQYEALDPPPTSYAIAIEYNGTYYSWELSVV